MAMDSATMISLGKIGAVCAFALAACGSGLGTGAAAIAAAGAWKKCYIQNKAAPFMLVVFIGAPLSQTIYGMIVMGNIITSTTTAAGLNYPVMLAAGILGGLAMGISAWLQGMAGAAASDALADTGQGFGNYIMAIGIVETVALFVFVFIGKVL